MEKAEDDSPADQATTTEQMTRTKKKFGNTVGNY